MTPGQNAPLASKVQLVNEVVHSFETVLLENHSDNIAPNSNPFQIPINNCPSQAAGAHAGGPFLRANPFPSLRPGKFSVIEIPFFFLYLSPGFILSSATVSLISVLKCTREELV